MKKLYFLLFLVSALTNAQIISFPDANFKAALLSASSANMIAHNGASYGPVDTNSDGEIQVAEAQAIVILQFQPGSAITDFSGIENFSNLTTFGSYSNTAINMNLNGMANLQNISISGNSLPATLTFTNLPALTALTYTYSGIASLSISNAPLLSQVNIWNNPQLTTLNLIGLTALTRLSGNDCAISNLSITNSPALTELNLANSNLTSIPISNYPSLRILGLSGNNLTDTSGFTNINVIEEINLQGNQISNLVLPVSLPLLRYLYVGSNGFPTINLSGYPNLRGLAVNNNTITSLDFSNTPLIQQLILSANPIASLDLSNLSIMTSFAGGSTLVTELDFSNNPVLSSLSYYDNPNLTHINLKSGIVNTINYNTSFYSNVPNLMYICVDEGDTFTYSLVTPTPTVPVTSYCNFVPGGDYNTITGTLTFDADGNGCNSDDFHPYMKVNINDGTNQGSSFTSIDGVYTFFTQAGGFYWMPDLENPTWFNVTPTVGATNFADNDNNTYTQNFCLSANGVHPDLEIVVAPVTPARPGFDAVYKIVYRNKGNQTLSQQYGINFFYNQNLMDFVSTTVATSSQSVGSLSWDYSNLQPFESRSILVTMNINSPIETNPVNIGDVLTFTGSILPQSGDENTGDNTFVYNQTVVGAFDPNDITCIQGNVVSPIEIGNYLHYMIRFENTGTFQAENIVVKVDIDPADFDINTLQLLDASHSVDARINGDTVEFVFQTINLDTGGHGNVLLKLKSLDTLLQGDMVNKQANIFFDYNFPVETNNAETVFQSLSTPGFENDNTVSIYPNPSNGIVNIRAEFNIKSAQLFDVQGRLLQTNLVNNTSTIIDLATQSTGIYFVKVITDKGIKVEKLVKQ